MIFIMKALFFVIGLVLVSQSVLAGPREDLLRAARSGDLVKVAAILEKYPPEVLGLDDIQPNERSTREYLGNLGMMLEAGEPLPDGLTSQEVIRLLSIANGEFEYFFATPDMRVFTISHRFGKLAKWTLRLGLISVLFAFVSCLGYIQFGPGTFVWTTVFIAVVTFVATLIQYFATGFCPDWRSNWANKAQNKVARIRLEIADLCHKVARLRWSQNPRERAYIEKLLQKFTAENLLLFETWAAARTEVSAGDAALLNPLRVLIHDHALDAYGIRTTLQLARDQYERSQLAEELLPLLDVNNDNNAPPNLVALLRRWLAGVHER